LTSLCLTAGATTPKGGKASNKVSTNHDDDRDDEVGTPAKKQRKTPAKTKKGTVVKKEGPAKEEEGGEVKYEMGCGGEMPEGSLFGGGKEVAVEEKFL
ncbi:hypothetical protein LTS18_005074, partial [Coniosporium uncinatum]